MLNRRWMHVSVSGLRPSRSGASERCTPQRRRGVRELVGCVLRKVCAVIPGVLYIRGAWHLSSLEGKVGVTGQAPQILLSINPRPHRASTLGWSLLESWEGSLPGPITRVWHPVFDILACVLSFSCHTSLKPTSYIEYLPRVSRLYLLLRRGRSRRCRPPRLKTSTRAAINRSVSVLDGSVRTGGLLYMYMRRVLHRTRHRPAARARLRPPRS